MMHASCYQYRNPKDPNEFLWYGAYCTYDKDGNQIDYGGRSKRGDNTFTKWVWLNHEELEKAERVEAEEEARKQRELITTVLLTAVGIALIPKIFESWEKSNEEFKKKVEIHKAAQDAYTHREYERQQLVEKTRNEAFNGDYDKAKELYEKAEDMPYIVVPSLF